MGVQIRINAANVHDAMPKKAKSDSSSIQIIMGLSEIDVSVDCYTLRPFVQPPTYNQMQKHNQPVS